MNYIQISGGLGNQLFQYTFAKYIELLTGQTSVLCTDFYNSDHNGTITTPRIFNLDKFCTSYVSVNGRICYDNTVFENGFEPISFANNNYYKGYWQDKKYYYSIFDSLNDELKLKPELITDAMKRISDIMLQNDSVAIHVRRTDYLSPWHINGFVSLSLDYYTKAVEIITERTGHKPVLYIFSDDHDYIQTNMSNLCGCETVIMNTRNDYEDMYLMYMTKHHIIANSTFSWWGSILSEYPEGITIAPQKWFKTIPEHDLYPDNWLII